MKAPLSLILVALLLSPLAIAKDFGRVGATFDIGEIDMLSWIEARIKHFEKTGKMDAMKQEFVERVKQTYENPKPVDLGTTTAPQSYFVSANLTISKDIIDPTSGKTIAKKGTVINPFDPNTWPLTDKGNPLKTFNLSKVLVFFDARDAQQVTWAKEFTANKSIKWILTGGSPNKVSEILDRRIYFDQLGNLTRRLNVRHVPALVAQDGTQWKVTEFDVSQLAEYEDNQ